MFLIEAARQEYVPKLELDSAHTPTCSVRAIALYLPQFHRIPETMNGGVGLYRVDQCQKGEATSSINSRLGCTTT